MPQPNGRSAIFPSSPRSGGCARKKMLRSLQSGADGVVAHKSSFKNAFRSVICERPPRPLHQRWLRDFFFMSRPPLLTEEGNCSPLKTLSKKLKLITLLQKTRKVLAYFCAFCGSSLRRSNVDGNSGFTSGGATITGPGVCPNSKNRATRRASASLEFTGNVS